MLASMGFSEEKARQALKATDGDMARATDWIFSHGDDAVPADDAMQEDAAAATQFDEAAKGHYKVAAFVSHMGKNVHSGHYVCHANRNGKWGNL